MVADYSSLACFRQHELLCCGDNDGTLYITSVGTITLSMNNFSEGNFRKNSGTYPPASAAKNSASTFTVLVVILSISTELCRFH
ncbi:hypothetical protein KCP69_12645 [Salmonella enterica subsp. enterica]|nr:hypothetical protein KCP69_12645 [Salmonella enterica subsp. enterica]